MYYMAVLLHCYCRFAHTVVPGFFQGCSAVSSDHSDAESVYAVDNDSYNNNSIGNDDDVSDGGSECDTTSAYVLREITLAFGQHQ
jgi:hypothetical protein